MKFDAIGGDTFGQSVTKIYAWVKGRSVWVLKAKRRKGSGTIRTLVCLINIAHCADRSHAWEVAVGSHKL
jgi:hypothetical protein